MKKSVRRDGLCEERCNYIVQIGYYYYDGTQSVRHTRRLENNTTTSVSVYTYTVHRCDIIYIYYNTIGGRVNESKQTYILRIMERITSNIFRTGCWFRPSFQEAWYILITMVLLLYYIRTRYYTLQIIIHVCENKIKYQFTVFFFKSLITLKVYSQKI